MRSRGEVKLKENHLKPDSFLPNLDFRCFSNFTVWVPKQHQKQKEQVSHLPPLPEESALFHPRRQSLTGTQETARQLVICLEPVDVGANLDPYDLAADLDVNI